MARAIHDADGYSPWLNRVWDAVPDEGKQHFRILAEAALVAARPAPSGVVLSEEEAGEIVCGLLCLLRVRTMLHLNLSRMPGDDSVLAKNVTDALNDIAASSPSAEDGWPLLAKLREASK